MNYMSELRGQLRSILLLDVPNLPQVQWQGKVFKPSAEFPYIRERLDPVTSDTATLGRIGSAEERMIYNLDVFWPVTGFLQDAENMADALKTAYWIGRGLSLASTDKVYGSVLRVETRPVLEGAVFNLYPVRVVFFIRRPLVMTAA